MEYNRRISRRLHEEHQTTLVLWGRLEASLAAGRLDASLLKSAADALGGEIGRHFAFEEQSLFPRLVAGGEADLAELLSEEHAAIRDAAARFIAIALEDPPNARVRPIALELAERLVAHVQKEEMALLPVLDDLLDEDTDLELQLAYAG